MAVQKCCGDWTVGGVCALQRIATARQFISSKIDALTSAASYALCEATEKKGHIKLDVPIEAIAGCMMGKGCQG